MFFKQKIPRWWWRCESFLNNYNRLVKLIHESRDTNKIYLELKATFVLYWKILYDIYRSKRIMLDYPVDIFNKAQEDGLIEDKEIWLDFIKGINCVISLENQEEREELKRFLIDKFYPKLCAPVNFANKLYYSRHYNLNIDFVNYPEKLNKLDNNKWDLDKNTCEILIKYFREHDEIKRVWLFGSRINGLGTPRCDIDLFIDSPYKTSKKLIYELEHLPLPYQFDVKNIYDKSKEQFVKKMMKYFIPLPILIYDKEKKLVEVY